MIIPINHKILYFVNCSKERIKFHWTDFWQIKLKILIFSICEPKRELKENFRPIKLLRVLYIEEYCVIGDERIEWASCRTEETLPPLNSRIGRKLERAGQNMDNVFEPETLEPLFSEEPKNIPHSSTTTSLKNNTSSPVNEKTVIPKSQSDYLLRATQSYSEVGRSQSIAADPSPLVEFHSPRLQHIDYKEALGHMSPRCLQGHTPKKKPCAKTSEKEIIQSEALVDDDKFFV